MCILGLRGEQEGLLSSIKFKTELRRRSLWAIGPSVDWGHTQSTKFCGLSLKTMDEMLGQDKVILAYDAQSGWVSAHSEILPEYFRGLGKLALLYELKNETDIVDTVNARCKTRDVKCADFVDRRCGCAALAQFGHGPKILPASQRLDRKTHYIAK